MPDKVKNSKIARSFGKSSNSYDSSARLQRYSGQQILSFLPEEEQLTVVDLGSGTGFFSHIMVQKFDAVFAVDLSEDMLEFARQHRDERIRWFHADMHHLPFDDHSVDVVYSNLAVQWSSNFSALLEEVHRVLKPGGRFIFTTLLDGTLNELKQAWSVVDCDKHVNDFKSLEHIESDIHNSCFSVNSLVQHPLRLDYHSVKHLACELKGLGANHVADKSRKGLSGRHAWLNMVNAYEAICVDNSSIVATYQLCLAHLTKPLTSKA
ncbi:malonyl-ACP O-methyltransferase BioC [Thalassotalea sp. Y01]|uniref:malonyl-ACP O-methyltransferase BioC n=1 Tax=Thalassotalea sp. Y01 TaxID=2729613 RepID=UPI00145F3877|nr:malonyl-ACP O-methyltransferase BioC [Thalassotalea sp. Y01]NMP15320.1 malonyl-ACP O-methyltransferase BioC [Thalassotalea sp. Y01]